MSLLILGVVVKRILFLLFFLVGLLSAENNYSQSHFLFCLKSAVQPLHITRYNKKLSTNIKALNHLIAKYGIIKIEKWLPDADARDVADGVELSKIYRADFKSVISQKVLQQILQDFRSVSEVHSAEPQAINHILGVNDPYVPNDPYFNRQWYLKTIGADKAWGLWDGRTPGDSTILIGITDTGIDYTHPDLAQALWVNLGEDANGDGRITDADINHKDDDGNGYVDDFRGWDFADVDNDVMPPNAGPTADLSHGTHVSGIVAAVADNNIGIAGISFRSKILVTKHAHDTDLSEPGIYDGYKGIDYCAKMGAKIINCSWGGGYDFYGKIVVDNVTKNYGAIVVCAAGNDNHNNDGNHQYPSDFSNTIAIASTNRQDKKAYYSNYGGIIDLSAPGGEGASYTNAIYSAIHVSAGSYTAWQGTSMASPVAAGAFALLKAWFPEAGRSWLINQLKTTADNIDEVNPSYNGLLGAGRIDVYKAIASSIYPHITLLHSELTVIGDTTRKQIRPGDRLRLKITLQNTAGWQDADNVTVTLNAVSDDLTLIDSTAGLGRITTGDSASNLSDALLFSIASQADYTPHQINLQITANDTNEHPYHLNLTLDFALTTEQKGFPLSELAISAPPAIARFGNGLKQIVLIANNSQLYSLNADGSIESGFPITVGTTSAAPLIADVTGDGQKEIITGNRRGEVRIFRQDGSLVKMIDCGETIYGDMAVANLDDDAQMEIIFGAMKKTLHALKPDSSELPGFPLHVSSLINQGVAVGDLTGDGRPEIVFATYDNKLQAIQADTSSLAGFPVELDDKIIFPPLIVGTATDTLIIAVTKSNKIYLIGKDGSVKERFNAGETIEAAPALCDMDGDGRPEIFFGCANGKFHALNLDGNESENFPVSFPEAIVTSAVFADLDRDGKPEIFLGSSSGKFYIINHTGQVLTHFPADMGASLKNGLAVGNIDQDDREEIVVGDNSKLHVLELNFQADNHAFWQTYLGSNRRTGYYSDALTGFKAQRNAAVVRTLELTQNYPNPFNPQTSLSFSLPQTMLGQNVRLEIFNILGQRIRLLFNGKARVQKYRLTWLGQNDAGLQMPSGIYFYRLSVKGNTLTRRMLLMK